MIALSEIISTLMTVDGLFSAADFDVTDLEDVLIPGYRRSRGAIRDDLDALRKIGLFDIVEADTKIYFRKRGGAAVVTIASADVGAFDPADNAGDQQPEVTTSKTQDMALPVRVTTRYRSPSREYEDATQASPYRLVTTSINELDVEVPASLTDDQAAQIADILMRNAWAERYGHQVQLDAAYAFLREADPVLLPIDGRNVRCRIIGLDDVGLILRKLSLVRDDDGAYVSTAVGTVAPIPSQLAGISDTALLLLDLPMLNDGHNDAGIYAAPYPANSAGQWSGADVYSDYLGSPQIVGLDSGAATVGTVDMPAAAGITTTWDTANALTVIVPGRASLSSKTDAELIRDFSVNAAAVGAAGRWEILQFRDATLQSTDPASGDRTYQLSTLLRGRRGTEWAVGTGIAGDFFCLLDDAVSRIPMPVAAIGVAANYRGVTNGLDYDEGADQVFISGGMALKPFSPVGIAGAWAGSDVTITWSRRTRFIGDVPDAGGDVVLGEAYESYDIELYVSGVLVDSATVAAATFTSSAGTEGATEVRVYQNSALVGRGTVGMATV